MIVSLQFPDSVRPNCSVDLDGHRHANLVQLLGKPKAAKDIQGILCQAQPL